MRRIPKFKIYSNCNTFLLDCPKKLFNFNHSKWKRLKNKSNKDLRRKFFNDFSLISVKQKFWEKRRLFFKSKLNLKRTIMQLCDSSLKLRIFKKDKNYLQASSYNRFRIFTNTLLRLEYQIDILLFRLSFYPSIHSARSSINLGKVWVNNQKVSHNYGVSEGDIIKIDEEIDHKKITSLYLRYPVYRPFVEIDFYTSTIVITKNLTDLSLYDFSLFLTKPLSLAKLLKVTKNK